MIRRIALAAACALLAGCNPKAPPATSPSPKGSPTPPPLSLKISGKGTATQPVRIVQTRPDNRRQYELVARSYESIGAVGTTRARFNDVRITFFDRNGTSLAAQAPQAIVNQAANTIELRGGVHARNSEGMTLSCDDLVYNRKTEMIHGRGHVVITDPNGFAGTGNRFDSNVSLTSMRMQ